MPPAVPLGSCPDGTQPLARPRPGLASLDTSLVFDTCHLQPFWPPPRRSELESSPCHLSCLLLKTGAPSPHRPVVTGAIECMQAPEGRGCVPSALVCLLICWPVTLSQFTVR